MGLGAIEMRKHQPSCERLDPSYSLTKLSSPRFSKLGKITDTETRARRLKAPRFSYVRPQSLDDVLRLLGEHGEDARILAGGQSLMPVLNMRLAQPKLLIDINRIDALKGISISDGMVRIGALARHAEVMASPIVAQRLPLIAEAMPHVAHVAVRNRGTFGGSIALADPAAELPACILALRATVRRR